MKLSICMMVKNEEKNLDRCLKSLQLMRDVIECELIIVDTGSEDSTVEIAQKYTDKIYFHTWNNNFSEMRNISISYAKGEWIMIIDADEEIDNCKPLIEFFKSSIEKSLNTLFIFVKNYAFSGSDYKSGIVKSPRLFKNDGDFKYKGVVHNQPVFKKPYGQIDATLLHYGYVIDDKETAERKFNRTKNLLLGELKKTPQNPYYLFQLGVTYGMHNEHDNALKYVKEAYEIVKEKKLDLKNHIYVFNQLIEFYMVNGLYKEAEEIGEETISIDKENLDAYFNLGKIKLNFNEFYDGEKCYKRYLDIRRNLMNITDINNTYYTVTRVSEVYMDLAKVKFKSEEYEKCVEYLMDVDTIEIIEENYKFIVSAFLKNKAMDKFVQFYNNRFNIGKQILKDAVIIRLEEELKEFSNDEKLNAFKEFEYIENENYCLLAEIRLEYLQDNLHYDKVEQCFQKINFNIGFEFYGDIIYYGFLLGFPMDEILINITEKNIDTYFEYIKKKYDDFPKRITTYYSEYLSYMDIGNFKDVRFLKNILRYILAWNEIEDTEYKKMFNEYVQNGILFINMLYSDFAIKNEMVCDLKNKEEICFVYMYKAQEYYNKDEKLYLSYLRKALIESPFMKRGVEMLLDEFNEKIHIKNEEFDEFENYKKKVKNTIKVFIDDNKLDDAGQIISEYEQIVKDDVEIILFKSKISLKKLEQVNRTTSYKM